MSSADPAPSAISLADPASIASLCLHRPTPGGLAVQVGQTEERIELVRRWRIQPGERVLEIGCGQGDCTAVLAAAVGEHGHVTAIDPGSLDYGSPYTLGQAQAHLSQGPLGARITWVQADPLDFLAKHASAAQYDVAVLAQCLWYFHSPSAVLATLRALAPAARRVCISEYSLSASAPSAIPNVLAVLAQAALECRKAAPQSNVRTVLAPARIRALAEEAGLRVQDWAGASAVFTPPEGMFDGRWEVHEVLTDSFEQQVESVVTDEREKSLVLALRDAVVSSKNNLPEGQKISTMDIWVASFEAVQNC